MQAFGADTVQLNAGVGGVLESATVNGRFNVTLDARAGGTATDATVNAATIALPSGI